MKWEKIPFSELVEFPPKVSLEKNELYDNIPMDVVDGGIKYVQEINQRVYTGGGAKFANGDTIFARITPCLENGKISKVKGLEKEVGFGSTEFFVFRAKENISDPDFIYYLAKTDLVRQPAIKSMVGASGRQRADKGVVEQIKVPKIPLPTQCKMASTLSAYDDLIENNLKRIKLLEEKAELQYKELMQEISNDKINRKEYIKDCLAFYIGGGWGEEEYKEGFTEPAYVIRGTDIPDAKKGEIGRIPFRYHKESNLASRKMQEGDIVFEVSGGSKGQSVGRSLMITDKFLTQFKHSAMCASFCKLLRPNETVASEFFYLYLLANYENGVITQYEKHSASNIVNYGFEEFIGEQKITIPKDSELRSFIEQVKPIFTLISTLGEQNAKLREARDILLPRLMSGEIEV
ncbi:MAG: restriction endonuclease subunit S [Bacteroidetes bacterium]|nr:restriction endonuclease subunit S [Bacteroidota bacterium]